MSRSHLGFMAATSLGVPHHSYLLHLKILHLLTFITYLFDRALVLTRDVWHVVLSSLETFLFFRHEW